MISLDKEIVSIIHILIEFIWTSHTHVLLNDKMLWIWCNRTRNAWLNWFIIDFFVVWACCQTLWCKIERKKISQIRFSRELIKIKQFICLFIDGKRLFFIGSTSHRIKKKIIDNCRVMTLFFFRSWKRPIHISLHSPDNDDTNDD